jgi:hypothetical protein
MSGHRSWTADRKARLTDPEVARRAAEARAELDRRGNGYRRTLGPAKEHPSADPDPASQHAGREPGSGQPDRESGGPVLVDPAQLRPGERLRRAK